jgi:short-subunit dehydrogenase
MSTTKPTALVTGASGGIGEPLANSLARDGYDLVLVARGQEGLARAAGKLRPITDVATVALDLQQPAAGEALQEALDDRRVDLLVNNAGYGVTGRFLEQPREAQIGEITLNVEALTDLTHRFVGRMRREGFGQGVINVASTAAFQPGPHMAVYYATKAYVLSFTEALAQELRGSGLSATALCPGPVATGFQARAEFDSSIRLTKVMKPRSAPRSSPRRRSAASGRGSPWSSPACLRPSRPEAPPSCRALGSSPWSSSFSASAPSLQLDAPSGSACITRAIATPSSSSLNGFCSIWDPGSLAVTRVGSPLQSRCGIGPTRKIRSMAETPSPSRSFTSKIIRSGARLAAAVTAASSVISIEQTLWPICSSVMPKKRPINASSSTTTIRSDFMYRPRSMFLERDSQRRAAIFKKLIDRLFRPTSITRV